MDYNHTRNYFDYKGIRYGVGTIVKIKWEPYGCRSNIEKCNGIAEFVGGTDDGYIRFKGIVPGEEYRYYGIGWIAKPEDKIEKIIKPVYYEHKPNWQIAVENYEKTHPALRPDVAPGTILYIAAMLVGSIFKGNWVIWIIATVIYINYLIDLYRD